MINLKNKPTTLFIIAPILGVGILGGISYIIYALIGTFFAVSDADAGLGAIGIIAVMPFMFLYLAQIAIILLIGFFLIWGVYKWSVLAIIASTVVSPLVLVFILASIANQFGYTVDLSSPVGTGFLIFFLLTPVIMGAIAYNDIRYRLRKIKTI